MPIRRPKPTSPGRRFSTYPDFAEVTRSEPEKSLDEGLKKSGGRNSNGRKTARHRGGGARRLYRKIDFKRRKDGVPAKVAAIEYDPNRSAYIALLHYVDGEKRYILAPNRLRVGMTVASGPGAEIAVGNALPLRNMPVGTIVHNVELHAGRGGQLGRSAGIGIQLMAKDGDMATLRLPSGEMRLVRRVPRDRRHDRQRGPPERQDRQGRPQAPHGRAPADARHGHEPGRPPARRRRGIHHGGAPSGDPVGSSYPGLPHEEEEQGVRPLHRSRSPPWEGQALVSDESFEQEGAVGRGAPDGAHRGHEPGQPADHGEDVVARVDDLPRDGR